MSGTKVTDVYLSLTAPIEIGQFFYRAKAPVVVSVSRGFKFEEHDCVHGSYRAKIDVPEGCIFMLQVMENNEVRYVGP